ncbi:oxidoreductase [Talaromyces proteolyticus]|uniref:Oxidoreductase n=1 Tax=Talaromyces proteolyticus TaxID=1131652 RepID=A0AAD4KIM9_9EURO|nr:oxidoreductase [Talaromyces proteolyticus]KAH8690215.1 oxidoreductase [Talaromyces proteolyticus]
MSNPRVLIVGASIAGPTAAYWLAKAGAKVTIIERFPKLRTNGQNVDIRTVGVTVMRRMAGMEATVRSKMIPMEGVSFVNTNGQSYGTLGATGNPDQQSLVSEYEIFRGDLSQILFDMTKDNENITYIFGEQVTSIRQQEKGDGPVTVEFANGLPPSEFDLVVACDGGNSRTRAIGLGCAVRDHITPANCWAAYFSIKQDLLKGTKLGHAYNAPGGRFIGIATDSPGVTRIAAMNFHPPDNPDATLPFREALKQGDDALKKYIANHFKGCGWICDELSKEIMEAQNFYASEIVQVKVPSIYKGRFVLVGDAGYAPGPTGTGTSLAMAGAYVLAGEVGKHKGDLAAALRGYEEQMRPIINDMQKIPRFFLTVLAPQTAWGIWLRNIIFAFITLTRLLAFVQKLSAGAFSSTDKHNLPDYDWVS